LAVVRYLVEQGADKDKADEHGMTPLILAAKHNRLAVVQYLAKQGVDIGKADINGETPLIAATWFGNFAVVQYLVEQGADKDYATGNCPVEQYHFGTGSGGPGVAADPLRGQT